MLKFLKIQNFQSHKNTEIYFSKGINVIVGNSTSGKTAIFRAFQWLLNNRPLGNRFKSVFSKENESTSVYAEFEATTEYGDEFVAIDKNKETTYSVGAEIIGVTDMFKGIGSEVPDSAKRIFNLDEINIQNQLDQHFLITSSPGEVARIINKIIHLENIDIWVSSLTSKINNVNKQIKIKEEDAGKMYDELSLFPNLDDFESCISEIENLQKEMLSIEKLIEAIESIALKIDIVDKEIAILEEWLGVEKYLKEAKEIYDSIFDSIKKIKALENFIECCEGLNFLIEWESGVSLHIKKCIGINSNISDISNKITNLYKLHNSYIVLEKEKEKLIGEMKICTKDYKKELLKISACPLCFSKITKEKINEIIASI